MTHNTSGAAEGEDFDSDCGRQRNAGYVLGVIVGARCAPIRIGVDETYEALAAVRLAARSVLLPNPGRRGARLATVITPDHARVPRYCLSTAALLRSP